MCETKLSRQERVLLDKHGQGLMMFYEQEGIRQDDEGEFMA